MHLRTDSTKHRHLVIPAALALLLIPLVPSAQAATWPSDACRGLGGTTLEVAANGAHLRLDAALIAGSDTSATVTACYSFDADEDHFGGRVAVSRQAALPAVSGVRVQDDWRYCQAPENVRVRIFHQWGWIGPQETFFYTALIEGADGDLSLCAMLDHRAGIRLILDGSVPVRVEVKSDAGSDTPPE